MNTEPSKRLSLALSILAEQSTTIQASSVDGGVVPVLMVESDARGITGHFEAGLAGTGSVLKVRVRDDNGCGHDITLAVRETSFVADDMLEARLVVTGVRRINGDRTAPRAHLSDLALVRVEAGQQIDEGYEFDARLADLGPAGVSFITTEKLAEGDLVGVMATVDGVMVRLKALVLHTTPAHYGRVRIGCEVTSVTDADRRRLSILTSETPAPGTRAERLELHAA